MSGRPVVSWDEVERLSKCAEERLKIARAASETDDRTDWLRNNDFKEALGKAVHDLELIRERDWDTAQRLMKFCGEPPRWVPPTTM
jgi:hypothetical protein